MRIVALLLVLVTGCSWLTARPTNNPRDGCSRSVGRLDIGLALASAGGIAAIVAFMKANPPGEGDHSGRGRLSGMAVGALVVIGFLEVIQGVHGLGVADRCEADRAKLLAAPVLVPGPPGGVP